MPLSKGTTQKSVSKNIATMMHEGKYSHRQAIAIALSVQKKAKGKDKDRGREGKRDRE